MVIIGLTVTAVLLILGHKPIKNGGCWRFEIGNTKWGGVSLGLCTLTQKNASRSISYHEYGHSLQNAIWGWLFPFVIGIPSVIRYWIFEYNYKHNKPNKDYFSAWFERQASVWGRHTIDYWNN